jgi:hypothetical protein
MGKEYGMEPSLSEPQSEKIVTPRRPEITPLRNTKAAGSD